VSRLRADVRTRLAAEIAAAGGREVSFVAHLDDEGDIVTAEVVARGTVDQVLALPGVAERGQMLLHNHPSGVLEPSQADLSVAARLHDAGVGFGIVSNDAAELYVVVEIPRARTRTSLDAIEVAGLLGRNGPVARALGQYEDRPSQRDMAAYVADLYNDGGIGLLEAGTGVGKSFAYLVPAIRWALANGERTVVSTNTINLQEQLAGKDLPLLARAFGRDGETPTFALLKGWRNYLCLARLELAVGGQLSLIEESWVGELQRIAAWARKTADGSLADLAEPPPSEVWDEVSAEPDLCPRLKCPHFERCFLFEARRRAADADVVVVNHHLLASDLAVRRAQENWQDAAVLPPYRRLVLDEGHHLEDTAAQHLGAQVTSWGVVRLLGRLERNGKGLLPTLLAELTQMDDLLSGASVRLIREDLLRDVADARTRATDVFRILADHLTTHEAGEQRLTDAFVDDPIWEGGLGPALDDLLRVFARLRDGVEIVADRLELAEEADRRSQLLGELRGVVRRLQTASDALLLALRPQPGTPIVRWIERRGSKPQGELPFPIGLAAVPLDLAPILKESLFDRIETIVVTSATLAAGGDFAFYRERVGLALEPNRVRYEEVLASPFDFPSQCLFGVPTDLADPRGDQLGHDRALATVVLELAHASDGGMFVLFTSHAALRRVASAVRAVLGSRWPLLVQGEAPRDLLLRRFRDAGSAILFGTDSFWEGVDVPGKSLRALVLAKLPFKVPTEPLTAARLERLEAEGRNAFMHYLVPQAALKLKQGFGRLIRTTTDVGVVILMDSRIVTKRYGELLLESLPPADRVIGPWATVRAVTEDFFARHGIGSPA
jgi:ATP-dependent DNA helicase DinG